MAYEIPGFTRSYESNVDLSASRYRFVKLAGLLLVPVSAVTDAAVGVLQNMPNRAGVGVFKPGENNAGTVMVDGVSRVMSGIALAAGVAVYLDAVGRATTVAQAGKCVGVTETACTAADQVVALLIKPLGSFN